MAYVQFLFDRTTKRIVADTVSSKPVPLEPASEQHWKVVLDARGRVVLRAGQPGGASQVVGTAKWSGEYTSSRDGILEDTPSSEQWKALDGLLWPLSQQAGQTPTEPSFLDNGAVVRLDSGKRIVSKLWAVVFLIVTALGIAAYFVVDHYWHFGGNKANGASCTTNSSCVTGHCDAGRCAPLKVRGDRCTRDRQCASHTCTVNRTCE